MKYRKRTDGSLTTKSQLIAANPNTSLPKTWTAETLDFLGVDPVLASPKPAHGEYEVVVAAAPVLVAGKWMEAWAVQPMFVDTPEATAAEQQAAYTAAKLAKAREGMVITMRQCRLQLLVEGKLADVDAAIAGMPEPDRSAAQVEWEYASVVERVSGFVASLGFAIGYDDAAMDALFEGAKEL